MSTIEKLIVQIFERKNSIIEQVKHQIDLYDQQLASRLVIDGIVPPSWLWNPGSHSQSSDPTGLKKEELISELLLPVQQPCQNSLYNGTVYIVNKDDMQCDSLGETNASIEGLHEPTFSPHCRINNVECDLNGIPQLEPNITSPQDRTYAGIQSNFPTESQSLPSFKRSKSRQKALELRNSVKTRDKEDLRAENANVQSSGGSKGFIIASLHSNNVNGLEIFKSLEMTSETDDVRQENVESSQSKETGSNINSGRIIKLGSSCQHSDPIYNSVESDNSLHNGNSNGVIRQSTEKSSLQLNHVNESFKTVYSPDITNESANLGLTIVGEKHCKENGSGRVIRSQSSCCVAKFNSDNLLSELGISSDFFRTDGDAIQTSKVRAEESSQRLRQSRGDTDFPTVHGTQVCAGSSSLDQKDLELYVERTDKPETEVNDANEYVGGSVRSQTPCRPEYGNSNQYQNAQESEISSGIPSSSQNNHVMCIENASGHPSNENCALECRSRITVSCSKEATKGKVLLFNSNISVPPKSQPGAASPVKLLGMCEADVNEIVLTTDMNVSHSTDIINIINHESCASTLEETVIAPDIPIDALLGSSVPGQNGASVGVMSEALGSGFSADSPMFVNPKKLDFDDNKRYSLNATISFPEVNEGEMSLETEQPILLDPHHIMSSQPRRVSLVMEHSWLQYKRRKIEGQLTNVLSASPSLTVEALHSIHRNAVGRNLTGEVANSPTVPSSSNEVQRVTQTDDMGLNLERPMDVNFHILERSNDAKKFPVEEGDHSSGGRDRSETTFTFKLGKLVPSMFSNLIKQETRYSKCYMREEVGASSHMNTAVDVRQDCNVGETQDLLHLESQEAGVFSSNSIISLHNLHPGTTNPDSYMPILEGFTVETDDLKPQNVTGEVQEDGLPKSTLERASNLEQLCKSVTMHTPLAHISIAHKLHQTPHLYQSVPNGLLENTRLKNTLYITDDRVESFVEGPNWFKEGPNWLKDGSNHIFHARSYSDGLSSWEKFNFDERNPYRSPVGKLWERSRSSYSGGSENDRSSNPEFTCFPIAEDPNICEGSTDEAADTFQEDISSIAINKSMKREPLSEVVEDYYGDSPPTLLSEVSTLYDRVSFESLGNQNTVKQKLRNQDNGKRKSTNKSKENQNLSLVANGVEHVTESYYTRFRKPKLSTRSSLRIGGMSISKRQSKRNNIVSSITSFVPLVQQKQAAAVITGKRDIKVKALEAAEAAKRLEEKKENDRNMKKEALKLKRARLGQENLRELELKKKKKEEAQKKKVVDMAVRKRVREEEEKKEMELKRKRTEEVVARRQRRDQENRLHVGKQAKEIQSRATDVKGPGKKETKDYKGQQKIEPEKRDHNKRKIPEIESRTMAASMTNIYKESIGVDVGEALGCIEMVKSNLDKAFKNVYSIAKTSEENSYDISPYKESDDEEEEDTPNTKFIPSWSSKSSLSLAVSSQQQIDVDEIFSIENFCSISEVLMP